MKEIESARILLSKTLCIIILLKFRYHKRRAIAFETLRQNFSFALLPLRVKILFHSSRRSPELDVALLAAVARAARAAQPRGVDARARVRVLSRVGVVTAQGQGLLVVVVVLVPPQGRAQHHPAGGVQLRPRGRGDVHQLHQPQLPRPRLHGRHLQVQSQAHQSRCLSGTAIQVVKIASTINTAAKCTLW